MADLFNTRLSIRYIESNRGASLIDYGNIKKEEIGAISDSTQLSTVLSNSIYGKHIGETKNLNIENGFYKFLFEQAGNLAAKYTIKFGALVKYMMLRI